MHIQFRMLTNQNVESSITQLKKSQKPPKMHSLTPLTPYDTNLQLPMVKKLGKYEFSLDQKLGSGMAGDVYAGINTETGEIVCVKVIDKQLFKTEKQKTMLEHEIKCQQLVECEYTIKILEVFDHTPFCFIITEFCEGGDLYRLLQYTPNGLPEELVRRFGLQIAKALLKLKQMQIVHRDIKPENILLRHETAKLGDFGFAIEQKNLTTKQQLNIGSPLYMSLQALQQNQYSYASDIFSYGIVLYQMLHKVSPWQCNDEIVLRERMRREPVRFREGVSEELRDLVGRCLKVEVGERVTVEGVVGHVFFRGDIEIERENKEELGNKKEKIVEEVKRVEEDKEMIKELQQEKEQQPLTVTQALSDSLALQSESQQNPTSTY